MALTGLSQLVETLTAFDTKKEVHDIIEDNKDAIVDFQQTQMYEGRGGDGEYIRPFYSEDPYFKNPEAALDYAIWKARDYPNPLRPLDVPNLFINGYFYQSLIPVIGEDTYSVKSDVSLGEDVFADHPNAEGLSPKSSEEFALQITIPEFAKRFKEKTGLELSTT